MDTLHDASRLARDTMYVSIGFGVLGFQKLQVRRRELEQRVDDYADALGEPARTVARTGRAVVHRLVPFAD
jgi:hypothetical protein